MLRRVLIAVLLAGVFAAPAHASSQTLIPGLNYSRQLLFTPHGPVVVHVLVAPRPGGLWDLHPVLSDSAISGKQRLTGIERAASPSATVAGINADFFNAADGRPDGIVMQNRVLHSVPNSARSSIGIEPNGTLDIRHAAWNARSLSTDLAVERLTSKASFEGGYKSARSEPNRGPSLSPAASRRTLFS